jgi:hypothetical protein
MEVIRAVPTARRCPRRGHRTLLAAVTALVGLGRRPVTPVHKLTFLHEFNCFEIWLPLLCTTLLHNYGGFDAIGLCESFD